MAAPQNLPIIQYPLQSNIPSSDVQPYIDNGTNYQSNNPDFIQRDDNGNIIINQGQSNNQNLVLETIDLNYNNLSVVNNIDTRFKYFKFPAENIAVPDISFDGFGIDDLTSALPTQYRPSENREIQSAFVSGSGDNVQNISGLLMDVVIQGQPQTYTNTFEITRELKESGADLRFAGRLVHKYNASGKILIPGTFGTGFVEAFAANEDDTIFFFLIKYDYETGETIRNFQPLPVSSNFISPGDTQVATFNIVLPNFDFNIGDLFQLGAIVGQYDNQTPNPIPGESNNTVTRIHTIQRYGSTWIIKNAADPFDIEELAAPDSDGTSSTPAGGTTGGTPPSNPGGGNQGGQVGN